MSEETSKPGEEQARPVTPEDKQEPTVYVGAPQPLTPEGATIGAPLPIKKIEDEQERPVIPEETKKEPEEFPGKVVVDIKPRPTTEAPKKPELTTSEKMRIIESSTNLQEIVTLGNELLKELQTYEHPKIFRKMSDGINKAGQPELAAQFLLKAEEVDYSWRQNDIMTQLGKDIAELNENLRKQRQQ